jgi:UDP-N-acetylglucosamine 2-epimerase (non-hydrolysing)
MNPFEIACIAGARPNFIKIASLVHEISKRDRLSFRLIHTGQHFSPEMSDSFFSDLQIPRPHVALGVSGGTPAQQTAAIMQSLHPVFAEKRPDLVLVVGDVNSTVAAAIVSAHLMIPVAHVEAGLRSFDRAMPEEINRVVTDVLSSYLFTSEPSGEANLLREGIPKERIFFCGNVMIDTLLRFREKAEQSDILDRLALTPGKYAVVTLHRPSNVDEPKQLAALICMLEQLRERLQVVFPLHPRTAKRLAEMGIEPKGITITGALGYLDFLKLMSTARLVMTDSGGIQEETTILNVPCLTLRDNTERPSTITHGSNRLVGSDPWAALRASDEVLSAGPSAPRCPELWDGSAAVRIVDVLERCS